MKYDVDEDYEFETTETGAYILPDNCVKEGELYKLPNGKYLPSGYYVMKDGRGLIYEPRALSPFAEMLANCTEE